MSILTLLDMICDDRPNAIAVVAAGTELSYAELRRTSKDRSVRDRRQAIRGGVVHDVEDPEPLAAGELIGHKAQGPTGVGLCLDQVLADVALERRNRVIFLKPTSSW